jgi:hypothetical protein
MKFYKLHKPNIKVGQNVRVRGKLSPVTIIEIYDSVIVASYGMVTYYYSKYGICNIWHSAYTFSENSMNIVYHLIINNTVRLII